MQVAVWKATTIVLQRVPVEAGDWDAFSFKNFMELSLPKCQKPTLHGGSGEEGEGREL